MLGRRGLVGPLAAPRPAKPSPETELGLAGRAFSQSPEQRLTNNSGLSNYAENKPVLAWSSSALRRRSLSLSLSLSSEQRLTKNSGF